MYKDSRTGYSFPLYSTARPILSQDGDNTRAIAFLSRAGAAPESELPYTSAEEIEDNDLIRLPENYSHPIRIKEAYRLGPVDEHNRELVKPLVKDYGAVCAAYNHQNIGMIENRYYLDTDKGYGTWLI